MKEEIISALDSLGQYIRSMPAELEEKVDEAYHHNRWFTHENTRKMLQALAGEMLAKEKLESWLAAYPKAPRSDGRSIGLVMAGNLPLVGFHDLLCVLASGNKAQVKLSSKDRILLPFLSSRLEAICPSLAGRIDYVNRLQNFDAVVATGSNNSARYFEYYFGRYPHVIRKNRNSVAVIRGDESEAELLALGEDVFSFFGMGCRNVSKMYLPKGYDPAHILESLEPFSEIIRHDKYRNNYDYHRSLYLLNKTPHLASDFLMLLEDENPASPMATLHYEFYENDADLAAKLALKADQIQIIVSKDEHIGDVAPGRSQQPGLSDYADRVDTMAFLLQD